MNPTVEIKMLSPNAIRPQYQTPGAAGMDLHACLGSTTALQVIQPGQTILIPCGFAVAIPDGYEATIRSRSGLSLKYGITVANSPGTIDSDYRGEVKVILANHSDGEFAIRNGDRIAQMVVSPVAKAVFREVEELDETDRSAGGFGSTGGVSEAVR